MTLAWIKSHKGQSLWAVTCGAGALVSALVHVIS